MESKISQDLEKDKILTSDCCVECGEGWDQLVKKAIAAVARYNEIHKNDEKGPVKFVQIKEKFGYTLAIGLLNDKTKLSEYDNANFIYNFTKPYVADSHNLILEEVMTWKDAFDLEN